MRFCQQTCHTSGFVEIRGFALGGPALLTFLWAAFHDQVGAHAAPCLESLAYHSQRRSRRGRRAHYEGMAPCARVEHTVIESVDLEPVGRGGEVLVARVRPKAGAALLTVWPSLPGL